MKILHVIFSFNVGGAETMLVDIINEQARTQSVELLIINKSYNKTLINSIDRNVSVCYVNRNPGSRNPLKVFLLNLLIFGIKPDIIQSHNHEAIALIKYKGKAKLYLTIHDVGIPNRYFKRYDTLISVSETVRLNILDNHGPDSTVIYNGVSFSKIEVKKDYGITSKMIRIIQVSRLDHEKKGQDLLIKALQCLITKGINNLHIDLVGEGPSLQYLKELVQRYNLAGYVNFLGLKSRETIYRSLKDYHMLVQPSRYEGFGLTIVEGIAAGLPVIASDIDGPAEIIRQIVSGSLFKSGDFEELAFSIERVFELYKTDSVRKICLESREIAKQRFSIQETARAYIKSYSGEE